MMTGRASTSSSSFRYGWTYDVFLSFRGKDTRHGFTGSLYNALHQKGIHTFLDDEQLKRGDQITPSLVKAIGKSRIAIIVLSKGYAASSFCLDELVSILDCIKKKGGLALPIFYDVDPCDVRHQRGSYGEALAKHEERLKDNMERLEKWKMALHQVANLSGWHFKHGDGYEYEFIGRIVEYVSKKINRVPLHVADYPVGLESRVLQVKSLLYVGSDDGVDMIGIHGIGGIGKTTVARAVYNLIAYQFEGLCFLDDARKNSIKHGLVHLQETLLSETLGEHGIKLGSVNKGIPIIKHRLRRKKVLLVLDDVDKLEQLRATVGGPDWFGSGSKVIITTRDKHLLTSHGVERTYEVEELNKKEALELLNWNAFKIGKVDPSYVDILNQAVSYASGLPLALEVIGSHLFGKRIEEWKSALDQYKRIPKKEIQKILKVSFDSLEEDEQKIFLDIACCFKGHASKYVKEILYAHHGVCPEYGIGVLTEKSLIKINVSGHLTLHDLIEDMGKEIVRQESPKDPGKRSRLWFHEEIVQVLEDNVGTSRIQLIMLDFLKFEVDWDGKSFKKMKNLKTLIIRNGCFSKGPKYLPNSLRVLEWWGYPSLSLPYDFHPKKLVILELRQGCLKSLELFASEKKFLNLRVLNLNDCKCITEIPDVSSVPNLEELSFRYCENLIKIHESVGFLDKLRTMDAFSCNELRTFPPIKLTSLELLELSRCSRLESFPEILGKMESITGLYIQDSGIKELPFSIRNLTQLQRLELRSCGMLYLPSSIVMLQELEQLSISAYEVLQSSKEDEGEEKISSMLSSNVEYLDLRACNMSDEFLRKGFTWFVNVKYLDLSHNNFTVIPACIEECCLLRVLNLDDCKLLREIKGIPPNLGTFSARGCTSLRELIFDDCENLKEIIGTLPNIELLSARNCKSLTILWRSMLLDQKLHEWAGNKTFILPGTRIPEWFEHRSRGPSISFWFRNKFPTISLCLAVGQVDHNCFLPERFYPELIIKGNEVNERLLINEGHHYPWLLQAADHIYIFDQKQIKFVGDVDEALLENGWNHVEVSFDVNNRLPKEILQIGLHVVKQESCMEDIRYTNPDKRRKLNDDLTTSE